MHAGPSFFWTTMPLDFPLLVYCEKEKKKTNFFSFVVPDPIIFGYHRILNK